MSASDVLVGGTLAQLANTRTRFEHEARQSETVRDRDEISRGFEELLLGMLVKEMRQTSGVKFFGEGAGSHLLESMFDQKLSQALAASGGLGVADAYVDSIPGLQATDEEGSR